MIFLFKALVTIILMIIGAGLTYVIIGFMLCGVSWIICFVLRVEKLSQTQRTPVYYSGSQVTLQHEPQSVIGKQYDETNFLSHQR